MSSTPPTPDHELPREHYLNATYGAGIRSWLLTTDHKRIALLYLCSVTVFFFIGGVLATMIRIHLLTPGGALVTPETYNKLFTMHGVAMIFFFLIPSIPAVLGNFLIPIMIGAKDLAFPKVNLLSWYVYLVGGAFVLYSFATGGLDTGWTFYTPLSSIYSNSAVTPAAIGIFINGFSSILTGLNFIVTVHTMRAPGMTWLRLPLFVWAHYATSIIFILGTPVIAITLLLAGLERMFHLGFFNPAYGGDPALFQHMFWFYSHPAVYIMILPAMGVISECVCAFSRKNAFGYRAIAFSSIGIAFVGFFTWGHHLFVAGQRSFVGGAFGLLSMFVGIFTAIKVFNWVGTMYRGAITFRTPFAYICGFLYFLVFGGMTGVALATTSLDIHWHDTYFIIAHFHFIMVGASVMAFLAALHYWFPKMFGRVYHEGWGLVADSLIIIGSNATFIPQFLLGNYGMPRRYYQYPEHFQALNVASTAGATLLGFGFVIIFIYLVIALRWGPRCEQNPWRSKGFEWLTESSQPTNNSDQ